GAVEARVDRAEQSRSCDHTCVPIAVPAEGGGESHVEVALHDLLGHLFAERARQPTVPLPVTYDDLRHVIARPPLDRSHQVLEATHADVLGDGGHAVDHTAG